MSSIAGARSRPNREAGRCGTGHLLGCPFRSRRFQQKIEDLARGSGFGMNGTFRSEFMLASLLFSATRGSYVTVGGMDTAAGLDDVLSR
jgi:hypothetical protein